MEKLQKINGKKKQLLLILLCGILFMVCGVFMQSNTTVYAQAPVTLANIDQVLARDKFEYNGQEYSIESYKDNFRSSTHSFEFEKPWISSSVNNSVKTGYEGAVIGYYNDDPIINIIPKELFTTPGTKIYFGDKYGFIMDTYNLADQFSSGELNWAYNPEQFYRLHSIVQVIKMDFDNDVGSDGWYNMKITPLFEYEFAYITDKNTTTRLLSRLFPSNEVYQPNR